MPASSSPPAQDLGSVSLAILSPLLPLALLQYNCWSRGLSLLKKPRPRLARADERERQRRVGPVPPREGGPRLRAAVSGPAVSPPASRPPQNRWPRGREDTGPCDVRPRQTATSQEEGSNAHPAPGQDDCPALVPGLKLSQDGRGAEGLWLPRPWPWPCALPGLVGTGSPAACLSVWAETPGRRLQNPRRREERAASRIVRGELGSPPPERAHGPQPRSLPEPRGLAGSPSECGMAQKRGLGLRCESGVWCQPWELWGRTNLSERQPRL